MVFPFFPSHGCTRGTTPRWNALVIADHCHPKKVNFFRSLTFGLSVIVIKRNGYAKSVELRLINTGH
jgi:hypothetical protein